MGENLSSKAISFINKHGALLVFPIKNKERPLSLWKCLYPRTKMRWEWDEEGDGRLFGLWRLREELSRSSKVVYSKWYQGRATFFSLEAFKLILAYRQAIQRKEDLHFSEAKDILEALEMDSPLSTKQLKEVARLQGRNLEGRYNQVLKELWQSGLIVGFGEVQDSSFPSLALGATSTLFEEIWQESRRIQAAKALVELQKKLGPENLFLQYLLKMN